jgi:6-phosphogluconolactonase
VNADTGALAPGATVSTLPRDFAGGNSTSEIFVHPNGRFLYAPNRGHDSIAVLAIDASTGDLTPVEHEPVGGKTPRNFNLDPTGKWLLAAAQGSDVINVFKVDPGTGRLEFSGESVPVPTPVCVVFHRR